MKVKETNSRRKNILVSFSLIHGHEVVSFVHKIIVFEQLSLLIIIHNKHQKLYLQSFRKRQMCSPYASQRFYKNILRSNQVAYYLLYYVVKPTYSDYRLFNARRLAARHSAEWSDITRNGDILREKNPKFIFRFSIFGDRVWNFEERRDFFEDLKLRIPMLDL